MNSRHNYYLKYFLECKNVLDIGCKEGEFIEILKKNNIGVSGIDIDKKACDICRDKRLEVVCGDAIECLKGISTTYDGIYISHVIEHLYPEGAISLIKNSFNILKENGILVLITSDVKHIKDMMHGFWEDATHIRPYPLILLKRIFKDIGFEILDAKEKKLTYKGRFLWKIRDLFRNALVGDYYGRDEVYLVAKKTGI